MSRIGRWGSAGTTILFVLTGLVTVAVTVISLWMSMTPGLLGSLAWIVGVFLAVPVLGIVLLLSVVFRWLFVRRADWMFWVGLVLGLFSISLYFLQGRVTYPVSIETAGPVRAMQLPLEGAVVVGWGGDDISTNYHAFYPAQRWAYDLMHEPYNTESERLEDYGCYGKTVVSPVTGTVVFTKDGLLDQIPSRLPKNPSFPLGNSVGISLDGDEEVVVFLAHLMKGSLRVQSGQPIRAGAPLGRCGNSGNTSEPHVHIHAEIQPQLEEPQLIGQVGTPVPISFYLKDGERMPLGGEPPEIVEADRTLVQKPLALPQNSSFPWTIRIDDGNHNGYVFRYGGCCDEEEPATVTYTPISPEHSSSGIYSGGKAFTGSLSVEQREQLWQTVQGFAESATVGDEKGRSMGSVGLTVTLPAGERAFVGTGDTVLPLQQFLETLRPKN